MIPPDSILGGILIISYGILFYFYKQGFKKYPIYIENALIKDTIPLSIVIACRNPNENLNRLLKELLNQLQNQDFEIIIVDDYSHQMIDIIKHEKIKFLKLSEHLKSPQSNKNNKKEALNLAIGCAQYEHIACLDCDVEIPPTWFVTLKNFIATYQPKFAAGIHQYVGQKGMIAQFALLEQDILTAVSIGSLAQGYPTMCNGANMYFTKQAYMDVGGYEDKYEYAGGDDLFLYHRIYKKYPTETYYIKSLAYSVLSHAPETFTQLLSQRGRWIAKTFGYENWGIIIQSLIIFLTNILCVLLIFNWNSSSLWYFFPLKMIIDLGFIYSILPFYQTKMAFWKILFFTTLYPFYTLLVAFFGFFKQIKGLIK